MTLIDLQQTTRASIGWQRVCRRTDLQPLWGEAALVRDRQVALFLVPDGRVFAVSHRDPLTGASVMSRGIVGSKAGRPTIASPLHKDVYDLETGECLTTAALHLPVWRVREEEGYILVAPSPALIAASHGTSDPEGASAVSALVSAVREDNPTLRVLDAFVDVQNPRVSEIASTLTPDDSATIVPLLLSAGYHVHVDLAEVAGAATRDVTVAPALGPDPRIAAVLALRLREAGWDPTRTADRIVLAAAGSSDSRAVEDCFTASAQLAALIGHPVTTAFLSSAEPSVRDAVRSARADGADRVFVSTYLLAPGYFAGLAADADADVTTEPLLTASSTPRELVRIVNELYRRLLP